MEETSCPRLKCEKCDKDVLSIRKEVGLCCPECGSVIQPIIVSQYGGNDKEVYHPPGFGTVPGRRAKKRGAGW